MKTTFECTRENPVQSICLMSYIRYDCTPDTGLTRWRETLHQLESVSLSRRELSVAFGWSLFNWVADVACLLFAGAETLQIQLRGAQAVPSQFVEMIPYVLTIVALAGVVGRSVAPAALGKTD